MKQKIYIMIILLLLSGCSNFEWPEELERITGKNLSSWLKKTPLSGVWDPYEGGSDKTVVTNIKQIFPFLGELDNENGRLYRRSFYQQETIIFKDALFRESFAYAALLNEPQEVFLETSYSETGNPFFMPLEQAMKTYYHARLSETMIYKNKPAYKTAIYWVGAHDKTYLFGFYQNKNLVFQVAFPCKTDQKSQGLQKIKEINRALGLNIKEWDEATENQLEKNKNPKSFWKDPFYGIYPDRDRGSYRFNEPQLEIKIGNTDFLLRDKDASKNGVDYLFAYKDANKREYTLSFKLDKTPLNHQEYEKKFANLKYLKFKYSDVERTLFIKKEDIENGQMTFVAETYFRNDSILRIESTYPSDVPGAKEQLLDILQNLRIH